MTATIPTQTAIATCRCGKTVAVQDVWNLHKRDEAAAELWQRHRRITCECGRRPMGQTVRGKRGTRACGSWCTEGTGKSCTCECEGRNHGSAYVPGVMWYAR